MQSNNDKPSRGGRSPAESEKTMLREDCKKLTDAEYSWLGTFALKSMKPKLLKNLLADEAEEVNARIKANPAHRICNGTDCVQWFAPDGYNPEEWDTLCRELDSDIQYFRMLTHMYVSLV